MKWFQVLRVLLVSLATIIVASEPNHMLWNSTKEDEAKSRDKRYVIFPYNSEVALAMVVVIPLGLKHRNTYLSYNMEANFYLQYFDTIQGIVPPPFAAIAEPNVNAGSVIFYQSQANQRNLDDDNAEKVNDSDEVNANATTIQPEFKAETNLKDTVTENTVEVVRPPSVSFKKTNSTQSSSENGRKKGKKTKDKKKKKHRVNREILSTLLSRKKFYKILMHKMDIAGLNGEKCLLRAICETAEEPYTEHNGVLGDIIHIIFTPTTSRDEKLPLKYYEAIENGKFGQCRNYKKSCPIGILDLISSFQ